MPLIPTIIFLTQKWQLGFTIKSHPNVLYCFQMTCQKSWAVIWFSHLDFILSALFTRLLQNDTTANNLPKYSCSYSKLNFFQHWQHKNGVQLNSCFEFSSKRLVFSYPEYQIEILTSVQVFPPKDWRYGANALCLRSQGQHKLHCWALSLHIKHHFTRKFTQPSLGWNAA